LTGLLDRLADQFFARLKQWLPSPTGARPCVLQRFSLSATSMMGVPRSWDFALGDLGCAVAANGGLSQAIGIGGGEFVLLRL